MWGGGVGPKTKTKKNNLPEDEGMLFVYDEPEDVGFWMEDTELPLDIIFINEDFEVISVTKGQPESKDIHEEEDVKFVLELNIDSGILLSPIKITKTMGWRLCGKKGTIAKSNKKKNIYPILTLII